MRLALLLLALPLTTPGNAQWQLQDPHTTADLRGIDNVGGGVAWASGTNGTVLRTEDAGFVWQLCATPPGAEHLDFRAIQAFSNNIAVVMSSGKGDLSRLYKTTDGCQTWKLVFTNPDNDGFWDALRFEGAQYGMLLGDPVENRFVVFTTQDGGQRWERRKWNGLAAKATESGVFAASNSSLMMWTSLVHSHFVTGGREGSFLFACDGELKDHPNVAHTECFRESPLPLGAKSSSSGAFSVEHQGEAFVAVGGDYTKPADAQKTAAYSTNGGDAWTAATTPPHGYRSAVAYDPTRHVWITVGPNGTDISTDDGRNWRPLLPSPGEAPDADQHWNALSLPYAVGPHGRIATLRPDAFPAQR